MMQYNECETCGACDGRAGNLISVPEVGKAECMNCYDTRRTGVFTLHTRLHRTPAEISLTGAILTEEKE